MSQNFWNQYYAQDYTGIPLATSSSQRNLISCEGDTLRFSIPRTPSSSSDTCYIGEIFWDANYIYVAVANNQLKRVALSSF